MFAYKDGVSVGVRGPVSISIAKSVSPIEIISMQITKSVNGESGKNGKASDTMGTKTVLVLVCMYSRAVSTASLLKNRLQRRRCGKDKKGTCNAVRKRLFFRTSRRKHAGVQSLLVEA